MKLQILTPHWREEPQEMLPLLDSLANQQAVDPADYGIIIVYDGDEATVLPETQWQSKYSYDIRFVHAPHGGVSAARNAALDAAEADYVMFCDADDMFCHLCGLWIIFREIDKGFDTMSSLFNEETRIPGTMEPTFVQHPKDHVFVHGKVHRRQYLVDNNIRFNPALTVHEDSYFNILCQDLAPDKEQVKYCPNDFYLWKWRENSICRHDKDYLLKTYCNMLDSSDALVDEFERRGLHDKAQFYAGFMIFDAYYTMNKREWLDVNNKEYRDKVDRRMRDYYRKHKEKWDTIPDAERMEMSTGIRLRFVQEGMPMETITITQWLQHINEVQ